MPFILPQVAAKIIAHHETTVLFDPSGAACIPGGLWPCGLSAGAPPRVRVDRSGPILRLQLAFVLGGPSTIGAGLGLG
jgi:hypothetical protein